jgi:hypothetical protein
MRGRQKTLKEIIEDNIVIAIFTAAVATGATVAGVMEFLTTQHENILTANYDGKINDLKQKAQITNAKHDVEIEELKSRIAGITRSLAGQETLDVRKMFLTQAELESAQEAQHVKYFPDGHYYVSDNITDFKYEKTTEPEVAAQLIGQEVPQTMSNAFATLPPVDVWKGSAMNVNGGNFRYLFPYVMVEQFTTAQIAKFAAKIGLAIDSDKLSTKTTNVSATKKPIPKNSDIREIMTILDHDTVGNTSALYVLGILNIFYSSDFDFNVRRIEQVGPLMYMQVMLRLKDISVANVAYSNYYIIREYFLVTRADGALFSISTFLPTENPAVGSEAGADINEWLTSFRLVSF